MDPTPSIAESPDATSRSRRFRSPYVVRLSVAEVGCWRRHEDLCHSCPFEVFVSAGLPLAGCVLLGEEAHCEFMEHSGLFEDLLSAPRGGGAEDAASRALRVRLLHLSSPIKGDLNRQICEALIGLGATSVAVVSEGLIKRRLKSIPEAKDAVREAWLSLEGLMRQAVAASRGEVIPLWPVSILAENAPR
jgi:hypothetical protein